jgi:hypothetical protein
MKSAHRHELETNALAHRLEVAIQRYKPYTSQIIGVFLAIVAMILLGSYLLGSSATRSSETWDTYNQAITASPPAIDEIHGAAQLYPNTPMQQVADVTWADAQVFGATRGYLASRPKALEMLDKATSTYEGVVQSSRDARLVERAHLGLARIYEMQNKLDKSREEYGKITGAYTGFAKAQIERLNKPDAQETYAWLATAQLPLPKSPAGPGTPGQRPEFSPGEMTLPPAGAATGPATQGKPEDVKATNDAFDQLLKSLKEDPKKGDSPDRYKEGEKPADGKADPAKAGADKPAEKAETKPADKPAKKPATAPSTEKSAK